MEALSVLVAARAVGAQFSPIMDCDETFNYWEPLHYLLFGRGLQTWEYSPAYALRTYAYVLMHGVLAWPLLPAGWRPGDESGVSEQDKVAIFFFVRAVLGLVCATLEACLVAQVRARYGTWVSRMMVVFLATNAGMFHAGVALLPSSTCMYAVLAGYAAWMADRHTLGLLCGAFGVLFCWPFVALMFVPMGLHALWVRGVLPVLGVALSSLVLFLGVPALVDSELYGAPTLAIANLVKYNVLGSDGANLYGTEPWHFYLQNLALNFNLVLPLAAVTPLAVALVQVSPGDSGKRSTTGTNAGITVLFLSGAWMSMALFSAMDHKEERFLSMIYPILCLSAALTAQAGRLLLLRLLPSTLRPVVNALVCLGVLGSAVIGVSRSASLALNFDAPFKAYRALGDVVAATPDTPQRTAVVCVGKEWYRFPSSFFLPPGVELAWVPSAFDGLLPQPFSAPAPEGSRVIHAHFNDQNRGVDAAFASSLAECDFAIDLDLGETRPTSDPLDQLRDNLTAEACFPFLDADRSPALVRSFYLPLGISLARNTYAPYCLARLKPATP